MECGPTCCTCELARPGYPEDGLNVTHMTKFDKVCVITLTFPKEHTCSSMGFA